MSQRKVHYSTAKRALENGLFDLATLAGEIVGPSGASWQDVAGTAAANLRVLVAYLDQARAGQHGPAVVFPSPAEAMEAIL